MGENRKPAHLYVLLAEGERACDEVFVEVENSSGASVGHVHAFKEGEYRLVEFPDPAAFKALYEALNLAYAMLAGDHKSVAAKEVLSVLMKANAALALVDGEEK